MSRVDLELASTAPRALITNNAHPLSNQHTFWIPSMTLPSTSSLAIALASVFYGPLAMTYTSIGRRILV